MTKEEELEISLSKTIEYYEKHISELNRLNVMLYAGSYNSKEHAKQLALIEKALELACEELGKVEVFDKEFMECNSFYEYFKTKAKEMMKSEL